MSQDLISEQPFFTRVPSEAWVDGFSKQLLQLLANLPSETKLSEYILGTLVPAMNKRRGRVEGLTNEEIVDKLYKISQAKPGEAIEFIDALLSSRMALSTEALLEVADIAYYSLQWQSVPPYNFNPFALEPLASNIGLSMLGIYRLVIIKYITRMQFSLDIDKEKLNEAEVKVLDTLAGTIN